MGTKDKEREEPAEDTGWNPIGGVDDYKFSSIADEGVDAYLCETPKKESYRLKPLNDEVLECTCQHWQIKLSKKGENCKHGDMLKELLKRKIMEGLVGAGVTEKDVKQCVEEMTSGSEADWTFVDFQESWKAGTRDGWGAVAKKWHLKAEKEKPKTPESKNKEEKPKEKPKGGVDKAVDEILKNLEKEGFDMDVAKKKLTALKETRKLQDFNTILRNYKGRWNDFGKVYGIPKTSDEEPHDLAPTGKKPTTPTKSTEPKREDIIPKGKIYSVHGKRVGDSVMVQEMANKEDISSTIKEFHQDDDVCMVVVTSTLPTTGQSIDVCMTINYRDEATLEALKKMRDRMSALMKGGNTKKLDELNKEYLEYTSSSYFKMLVEIRRLEIKKFASRTAVTKARRQGAVWILSGDPREKEEVSFEDNDNEVANRNRIK